MQNGYRQLHVSNGYDRTVRLRYPVTHTLVPEIPVYNNALASTYVDGKIVIWLHRGLLAMTIGARA